MDDIKKLDTMIMRLFALKGKTGYTKFDVETWREILKPYDEKKLTEAFSIAIQKEGFFEIKTVLDELKPNNEKIAINEWDKIMQIAMQDITERKNSVVKDTIV